MDDKYSATLSVNKNDISMNHFVEQFLAHTVCGGIETLRDVPDIRSVDLDIEDGIVSLVVNKTDMPLLPFPNDIIAATITGLISVLNDADDAKAISIGINKK